MKIRAISTTGGAVLALALALPAVARTASGSGGDMAPGQRTADQLICADIATMDSAVVPGTLYFIAGYAEGQRGMGMQEGSTDVSNVAGTSARTGSAGTSSSASGSGTGTGTGSESASSGTVATGQSDSTGSASTGTGTDTASAGTTGQSGSAATGTEGSGSSSAPPQIAAISGFFEIPVEQVMRVCADSPARSVSDVVREEGSAGTGSSN